MHFIVAGQRTRSRHYNMRAFCGEDNVPLNESTGTVTEVDCSFCIERITTAIWAFDRLEMKAMQDWQTAHILSEVL